MDLYRAISELVEEKKKLDKAIATIESLLAGRGPEPKRRGRKFMSEEERRAVSDRMSRYWAARRKQKKQKPPEASS